MPNYNNTKIYKLYSPSNDELVYYGHTTQKYLSTRKDEHKRKYRRWANNKGSYYSSFKVMEQPDYEIVLIELFPCKDVNEARMRERYYIDNNVCVNKCIPGRTLKEYSDEYHILNKEKEKKYRDDHKKQIKEKNKQWYELNKIEYNHQRKEKVTCVCGITYCKADKARHEKSKRHQNA
jgi:hypothetical protein